MKKIVYVLFFSFILNYVNLAESSVQYSFHLRMDKLSFYSNENVELKMHIQNLSRQQQKFIMYDYDSQGNNYATFQPVVFDMNGNEAEIIVPYKLANMPVEKLVAKAARRTILLEHKETFVYMINLKKLYNLKPGKQYRIRGFFYPDAQKKYVIRSNHELVFNYLAAFDNKLTSRIFPDPVKQQIKKGISPSEIVLLMLNAEKKKKWKRFIKYINLKKFINAYPEFVREYQLADPEQKIKKEQEFVIFLTRSRDDYILEYEIVKEQIEPNINIAYVDVIVDRYNTKKSDRYKYRYTLEKNNDLWLVINLEATVLKGKIK